VHGQHSSTSKVACVAAGTVQYAYAVHDIKKGDQLCVHYTSLYEPRRVRQQALLQGKFFTCACDRCSTPIEQSVDRFLEVLPSNQPVEIVCVYALALRTVNLSCCKFSHAGALWQAFP